MGRVWKGGERRMPKRYAGYTALENSCVMARLRHVLLYLKMHQNVVDLGCGTGWNTKFASLYCKHIIGVDINNEAIKYARKINDSANITWLQTDMCKLESIENNSIDFIMSIEAIEHLTKDSMRTLFSETHRILKSDCLFVGTLPGFREVSKVNATKWHKYEPSMDDFKKLLNPYFIVIDMINKKFRTPDVSVEYTHGMFILKRRDNET